MANGYENSGGHLFDLEGKIAEVAKILQANLKDSCLSKKQIAQFYTYGMKKMEARLLVKS